VGEGEGVWWGGDREGEGGGGKRGWVGRECEKEERRMERR